MTKKISLMNKTAHNFRQIQVGTYKDFRFISTKKHTHKPLRHTTTAHKTYTQTQIHTQKNK